MRAGSRNAALGVFLKFSDEEKRRVGTLYRNKEEQTFLTIDEHYLNDVDRPVFSLSWQGASNEDSCARLLDRRGKIAQYGYVPPFFQNLLPEGALLEMIQRQMGKNVDQFALLTRLGSDLPGAVYVDPEIAPKIQLETALFHHQGAQDRRDPVIKFSLAGLQLKFSMMQEEDRITFPANGSTGNVIVKTPSLKFAMLPEIEFSSLMLLDCIGLRTANCNLVDTRSIEGLPAEYLAAGEKSLVLNRFDRADNGRRRVHMEDFAQVLGCTPYEKFFRGSEATVMNIVKRFATDRQDNLVECIARSVSNIMMGNGDAHLKNWSFLYPRERRVELSPAYDVLPTFYFGDNTLALQFNRAKNPTLVKLNDYRRAAGLIKEDDQSIIDEVRGTITAIIDRWPSEMMNLPMPKDLARAIVNRWADLEIVREVLPGFTPGAAFPRDDDAAPQP